MRIRDAIKSVLLPGALAIATLASYDASAQPRRSPMLVFGQEAPPPTLDPHFSTAISTRNIAMHIFEQLVTRDEKNDVIPELAESWQMSPGWAHLHVQTPDRRQISQRQGDDLGRREGILRTLQADGSRPRDPRFRAGDRGPRSADLRPQARQADPGLPRGVVGLRRADRDPPGRAGRPRGRQDRPDRHRPVPVRGMGAGQPRPREALRGLPSRRALQGLQRLRRPQGSVVRPGRLQAGQGAGLARRGARDPDSSRSSRTCRRNRRSGSPATRRS